jgi:glycosyltransferase involved in cell wall biosynthesis
LKFSIIIPTFNRAHHIEKAIQSVLDQTFEDWELLIIDDGSTDHTRELIRKYKDPRLHYHYQKNAERSAARNKGVELAKGEWLCFLDSDDLYLKDHLETIAYHIKKNELQDVLICCGLYIQHDTNRVKKDLLDLSNGMVNEIAHKFLIPTQVCVRRNILKEERFDIRFSLWEDTHLWMRIAALYPIHQIPKYTCIQNIHMGSTVSSGLKKVKLKDVNRYVKAVQDLADNYQERFIGRFEKTDFDHYIDSKYRMYLYQARQNRQILTAVQIVFKALIHRPSLYLLSEVPKVFLNKLGIGIHG